MDVQRRVIIGVASRGPRLRPECRGTRPTSNACAVLALILCTTVMSFAQQQQYTILAPASTSGRHLSPPQILPPSLSNKKSLKQASSSSAHPQRSPQPPGVTASVAQTAVDRLISAQLKEQGFDGAEPAALQRLGDEVAACAFTALHCLRASQ